MCKSKIGLMVICLAGFAGLDSIAGEETFSEPEPKPAAEAAPQDPQYVKYDLGQDGIIANWLVLGYLPGIEVPEKNRLDSIGGEEKISPYGGENVTLKGAGENGADINLTWKNAKVKKPEIPCWAIRSEGLYLFTEKNGNLIENSTAYAYCELASAEDRNLTLRMSGGDPIRIWLNGEHVEIKDRPNRLVADRAKVDLALKQGVNRLLVRIDNKKGDEFLSMRLVEESGKSAQNIKVCLKRIQDYPEMPQQYQAQDWNALISEIPPLAKSEDEDFFGANLSRTMTLLETGGQTKRPVRILFYGQSITASSWVWFLVRRLRERFPDTEIQAENNARSGWQIHKLNRAIKHDILRSKPDLVVLHAYGASSWDWEGIVQKIRRETTADIMLRTAHIAERDIKGYDESSAKPIPDEDGYTLLIRRIARKYGCELVEGRKEWLAYIRTHGLMAPRDLCFDGLHLSRKGGILMAQLFDRHFKRYPISQPWFKTVRRYEAMRAIDDRCDDEIQLIGDGWNTKDVNCATSTGKEDILKLKFYGNRVDLIMPQSAGKAKVLIDGKTPSELNILQGTFPSPKGTVPAFLMTYNTGDNAIEETWTLKFTQLSGDYRKFRYTVTGSKTGFDGAGDNAGVFVSESGRIVINNSDFNPNVKVKNLGDKSKKELEPVNEELLLTWSLRQPFPDEVCGIPQQKGEAHKPRYYHPYRYVTVVDGLPKGEHELTIIPVYSERKEYFSIDAVEVHCPPLWER